MPGTPQMRLEDFGIDPVMGFLPKHPPLLRLPDAYFEPWEETLDNVSHLLVAWKLRQRISTIPELSIERLVTEAEQQRAFLVLSLLSHAYVWGAKGEPVLDVLPRNLAKPWLTLSAKLGLRPISCHAALVYYNWRLLDKNGPADLSGGIDESWFYLITVAIEAKGARAMPAILNCLHAVKEQDLSSLASNLRVIADVIKDMIRALERMPENCDPYIFYHRVRIYFSGWSNMKDLPNGLIYEGDEGEIEKMFAEEGDLKGCAGVRLEDIKSGNNVPKRYPGGSAAQSALIHSLDVFLGIKHLPTGMKPGPAASNGRPSSGGDPRVAAGPPLSTSTPPPGGTGGMQNFLQDMRYHMPKKFRHWLVELEKCAKVQDFLALMTADNPTERNVSAAVREFDQCVANMKAFRDKHIQIVARYILIQARRAAQTGQLETGEGYHGMGPSANQVIRLDGPTSPIQTEVDSLVTNDGLSSNSEPVVSVPLKVGKSQGAGNRGTGGTEVMPFLKQSRDETAAASIGGRIKH